MKLFVTALTIMSILTANAQSKLFDQPVELKSCNISIKADAFVATTFIEMELYNPADVEVEGLRCFNLDPGQVVTAFQLDLNGKYRDGSIEERWKAVRAYSSIVGKRMDPAVLEMYGNYYKLHVYPVPAHASRKVTMTITQQMRIDNLRLTYDIPLKFPEYTKSFRLDIIVNGNAVNPSCNEGLLHGQVFGKNNSNAFFSWETGNIQLNKPISFSIPLQDGLPQVCISKKDGQTHFLLYMKPGMEQFYKIKPQVIAVYWDASLSANSRDLAGEINFLEKYISTNSINDVTITLFNQKPIANLIYSPGRRGFSGIRNYLLNYKYNGATVLGNLDFATVKADAILLFSDGRNTYGRSLPTVATVSVSCIASGNAVNKTALEKIIGSGGGAFIDLNSSTGKDAIGKIEMAENYLFKRTSNIQNIKIDQSFPLSLATPVLLSGTIDKSGNLQLYFGNSNSINKTTSVYLDTANCNSDDYNIVQMLRGYKDVVRSDQWEKMLLFGLTEKLVTPNTAFIVLEKVEDYVKYNIAPPKELEQKCAEMNYVYKSEYKDRLLKTYSEEESLQQVVNSYNRRIQWWDKRASLIDLTEPSVIEATQGDKLVTNKNVENNSVTAIKNSAATSEPVASSGVTTINEVVVTALGIRRQAKELGYSTFTIRSEELTMAKVTNVATGLAAKVSGLQVNLINNSVKADTRITLRGNRSILGNNQALLVVDDVQLPISYISSINPNDVDNVTVLKGASASALYGSDASNGVIIITTLKGRRAFGGSVWRKYKLEDVEDVDYMQEMKKAATNEYVNVYEEFERENTANAGFYFDMADIFFQRGMKAKALEVLYNAAEVCGGDVAGLKAIAYTLESWKMFDEAISIYKNIIEQNEDAEAIKRDLALAYFQNGNYQQALNTYYAIITHKGNGATSNINLKQIAISEMNAVIALHSGNLDLTTINQRLVRALPVDLRISVESNDGSRGNLAIKEPGGGMCNADSSDTKFGGHLSPDNYNYGEDNHNDYSIKNAPGGKYQVITNAYYSYPNKIPHVMRIIVFKNFQKPGQTIEIKNVILDNQFGEVEIGEVIF